MELRVWSSPQTWIVASWCDNDPQLSCVVKEVMSDRLNRSERLQDAVEKVALDGATGLGRDLLTETLRGVNWQELITAWSEQLQA